MRSRFEALFLRPTLLPFLPLLCQVSLHSLCPPQAAQPDRLPSLRINERKTRASPCLGALLGCCIRLPPPPPTRDRPLALAAESTAWGAQYTP